jgi:hypothetical protein
MVEIVSSLRNWEHVTFADLPTLREEQSSTSPTPFSQIGRYMFSVNGFYPPSVPLSKEGSPVLPLAKGELEGVSQGTLNTYWEKGSRIEVSLLFWERDLG